MLTAGRYKPNLIFSTVENAEYALIRRKSQLKHARNLRRADEEDNRATPARAKAGQPKGNDYQ